MCWESALVVENPPAWARPPCPTASTHGRKPEMTHSSTFLLLGISTKKWEQSVNGDSRPPHSQCQDVGTIGRCMKKMCMCAQERRCIWLHACLCTLKYCSFQQSRWTGDAVLHDRSQAHKDRSHVISFLHVISRGQTVRNWKWNQLLKLSSGRDDAVLAQGHIFNHVSSGDSVQCSGYN